MRYTEENKLKYSCPVCGTECVLTWKDCWPTWKAEGIASHFPVDASYPTPNEITGPDTGLIAWMNFHKAKDYKKADEVRRQLIEMGFSPEFQGNYYQLRYIKS